MDSDNYKNNKTYIFYEIIPNQKHSSTPAFCSLIEGICSYNFEVKNLSELKQENYMLGYLLIFVCLPIDRDSSICLHVMRSLKQNLNLFMYL
jgi:hypothetical protein